MKTTERLCLYGFTKEHAKRMMIDAGYYRGEEDIDAFKLAMEYIKDCQNDPNYGFHGICVAKNLYDNRTCANIGPGSLEKRTNAALKMGLSPTLCTSLTKGKGFKHYFKITLWQLVKDNIIAKNETYTWYVPIMFPSFACNSSNLLL